MLLALLVDLKCFQKHLARFCSREEIPQAVTDHVLYCPGLSRRRSPTTGRHGQLAAPRPGAQAPGRYL